MRVKCPACGVKFFVDDDLQLNEQTSCLECYAELEVVGLNPLRLKEVAEEAGSYNDYDDDDKLDS